MLGWLVKLLIAPLHVLTQCVVSQGRANLFAHARSVPSPARTTRDASTTRISTSREGWTKSVQNVSCWIPLTLWSIARCEIPLEKDALCDSSRLGAAWCASTTTQESLVTRQSWRVVARCHVYCPTSQKKKGSLAPRPHHKANVTASHSGRRAADCERKPTRFRRGDVKAAHKPQVEMPKVAQHARFADNVRSSRNAVKFCVDKSTARCLSNQVLTYRVVLTSGEVGKGNRALNSQNGANQSPARRHENKVHKILQHKKRRRGRFQSESAS